VPDQRRVAIFVVPGDASVEVDGQPARRRDGVVEIVGRLGEVHRLRAWKGTKTTEERAVTITASGASPARVDLNEPLPQGSRGNGATAGTPLRLGAFDE
jgi:serine/threonine-protein kinase